MSENIICLIESLGSGGAERQLVHLASQLKQDGLETEVWTYSPDAFYADMLKDAGVKWRYIPPAHPLTDRYIQLRRELVKAAPSVVVAFLDGAAMVACLIRLSGLKYRLIVSERNTTQHIDMRERLKFFLYRRADVVVPNSHAQSIYIKEHFPALAPKTVTIPNFVDTGAFTPVECTRTRSKLRILTVARVTPQKNVLRMLKVVSKLKNEGWNFRYDWFGAGSDSEYFDECVNAALSYGIMDVFRFHGQTQDVVSEYRHADVFCLPSLYEGYPNALCEAMSCGLPVLCSSLPESRMIMSDLPEQLMFDPLSEDDILDKFRNMLTLSTGQLQSLGARARESALRKFAPDIWHKVWLSVIKNEIRE